MNLIMAADELYAAFVSTPNPTPGQKEALKEFADVSNRYRTSPWGEIFKDLEPVPQAQLTSNELDGARTTAILSIAISLKRLADSLEKSPYAEEEK